LSSIGVGSDGQPAQHRRVLSEVVGEERLELFRPGISPVEPAVVLVSGISIYLPPKKGGCGSFEGPSRNVRSGVPGPPRPPVRGLPAVRTGEPAHSVARCLPSGRPTCALAEDLLRIL
jgi:hypothetical protein